MKQFKQLIIIAASTTLLASCSLFNKVTAKKETTAVTTVAVDKKTGTVSLEAPSGKLSKMGKMPTDDQLTGGRWLLVSVGEMQVNAEDEQPYIYFDRTGRFYAYDGCNILNGDYTVRSNAAMTFDNVLSSMKYCAGVTYAPAIAALIADRKVYAIDCRRIGQETYLYFKDSAGKTVVTYRRHNMEFLNGNWLVTFADGKKIADEEANLFIDVAELKVHGNTGCNFFNGELYIDPGKSNAVDFSNIGITHTACVKSDQERRIVVALEQASSAIAGKKENTVLFLDAKGKEVMTLKRINNEND